MDISHILSQLQGVGLGNLVVIVAILLSLIQVAPIKIDPWTRLFKWIGNLVNGDLMTEVRGIKEEIDSLKKRMVQDEESRDLDRAETARREILIFDDELRRGIEHSEELFNQIFESIKFYEKYCRKHTDYANHKAVNAVSNINDVYKRVKAENKFI